jgi:hypothetical protein
LLNAKYALAYLKTPCIILISNHLLAAPVRTVHYPIHGSSALFSGNNAYGPAHVPLYLPERHMLAPGDLCEV